MAESIALDPMDLPAEVAWTILSFLDAFSLASSAQVSRRWREAASHPQLWERVCRHTWRGSLAVLPLARDDWRHLVGALGTSTPRACKRSLISKDETLISLCSRAPRHQLERRHHCVAGIVLVAGPRSGHRMDAV